MAGRTTSSTEIKTGAGRFPLVHKLIQFADIRRHYKDLREALIASNRQAGSHKGWVTRWKKKYEEKYEASELAQKKLEIEIAKHLADKGGLLDQRDAAVDLRQRLKHLLESSRNPGQASVSRRTSYRCPTSLITSHQHHSSK